MSGLAALVQGELLDARKAQDKARVLLLGTVLSDIKNREIELRRDLNDADVIEVLRKAIKRRRESGEMFEQAGRVEMAATERREAETIQAWLPAAPSDDEIRAAMREAVASGITQMGAIIGKLMKDPRFKGRVDGNVLNRVAREELGTAK